MGDVVIKLKDALANPFVTGEFDHSGADKYFVEGPKSYKMWLESLPRFQLSGTGKWLISSDGYYPYCSECMKEPKNGLMTDYCPSCGARMFQKRNTQIGKTETRE